MHKHTNPVIKPQASQQLRISLTPSRVRDYITCPFRFKLKHLDNIRAQTKSPQLAFGNSIHAVLAEINNPARVGKEEVILSDCLEQHWDTTGYIDEGESARHFDDGLRALEFYMQSFSPPEGLVIGTEVFLSNRVRIDPNTCIQAGCKIDHLQVNVDDSLEVLDYKTNHSGELPSAESLVNDLPTFLTYLLARINYSNYPNVLVSQLNMLTLKKVTVDYTHKQLETNKQAFIALVRKLELGWYDPQKSWACSWCGVEEYCSLYSDEVSLEGIV